MGSRWKPGLRSPCFPFALSAFPRRFFRMSLYAVMNAVSSPEESASRRSEILTALHHNDGLPDCGKVDSRSVDRLVYSIASTTMKDPTKSESIPIAENNFGKSQSESRT